jgi:hypothetical protein
MGTLATYGLSGTRLQCLESGVCSLQMLESGYRLEIRHCFMYGDSQLESHMVFETKYRLGGDMKPSFKDATTWNISVDNSRSVRDYVKLIAQPCML